MSRSSGQSKETPSARKARLLTLPVFMTAKGGRSWAVFCEIACYGYLWDGDVSSKSGRDDLIEAGFAQHRRGFAFLNGNGISIAAQLGLLMNGGPDPWRRSFRRNAGDEVVLGSLSEE